ncbi:MAG TPA: AI-2E family transporter [Thermoanaerobaculia bacterium]|nr:AI-2E family transporter [Thermoanaerobaculia bacterium]
MNQEPADSPSLSVPRVTLQVIGILLATAAALWVVFRIRGVILLLVLAIFFAYLISPLVALARRPLVIRGRPRALPLPAAIAVVYLLIFGMLALAVWLLFPIAASQFSALASAGPRYAAGVRSWLTSVQTYERSHFPQELQAAVNSGIERALSAAGQAIERGFLPFLAAVAGFVPWLVLVPILALFLLKDADAFRRSVLRLAPTARMRWRGKDFFEDVNATLAAYIRAQLVACLIVGAACTAGFAVIGVPYAVVLGIAAGLLEFIPLAGPVTIGAVAVFLAAFRSPGQAVATLVFLIVLRIVEDYVVYPRIIGRGIHLHPLAIIFAILCGAELGGLAGIFFSIPVVAVVSVAVRHWREHRAEEVVVPPNLPA